MIVAALGLVLVAELVNVGTYNQAFNIFPVWAKDNIQLRVSGFDVPVTWFSTLDGLLTIAGTAFAVRLWARQAKRGREMSDIVRVAIGCGLTATAFLILSLASFAAGSGKAPIIAGVGFFLFADFALPWVDVVIMSLVSRAAPPAVNTTMLGVFYLAMSGGNFIVGWLGSLYERMSPGAFWLTHAAIVASGIVYLLILGRWISRRLAAPPETPATLARIDEALAAEAPGKPSPPVDLG
jgi:POT family proton-dependent oligopeptide transporter